MQPSEEIANIRTLFHQANKIVLTAHIRPDGDAIGSILGLGLALEVIGKKVKWALADGVPRNFCHLTGTDRIQTTISGNPDLTIVLDCSDIERTGGVLKNRKPDINIDHHITNTHFATVNLVEKKASTASIITNHLEEWGLPLTQPVAEALLTGILTDTIGFRTSNVTPETLRLAAYLMEHGANIAALYNRALINRSFSEASLWGQSLSRLQREGQLIWSTITLEDKKKAGYQGKGSADLIDVLSSVEDGDIALLFVETDNGSVKVSWRAKPQFNVSQIALQFGGGGHPAAAGADVPGTLEQVQQKVLRATQLLLEQHRDPSAR